MRVIQALATVPLDHGEIGRRTGAEFHTVTDDLGELHLAIIRLPQGAFLAMQERPAHEPGSVDIYSNVDTAHAGSWCDLGRQVLAYLGLEDCDGVVLTEE
jgi:hypothetical protein